MSWESTVSYYQLINQGIGKKLGGLHSAQISMVSVDFGALEPLMSAGDWESVGNSLAAAAERVEAGGADFLLLCTNTMHKVASRIEQAIEIPFIHIADTAGDAAGRQRFTKLGLLGTRFTMEQDFYAERLKTRYGITIVTPDQQDRNFIDQVIFRELCLGKIDEISRERYVAIIEKLADQGAEAVLLACTEIPLLVKQEHTAVQLLDVTAIHAERAVELAVQ